MLAFSRDFSNFQVPGLLDFFRLGTTRPIRPLGPVLSSRDEFELEFSSSSRAMKVASQAEQGHFNFPAETKLTICTSLSDKFFKFPNFASK